MHSVCLASMNCSTRIFPFELRFLGKLEYYNSRSFFLGRAKNRVENPLSRMHIFLKILFYMWSDVQGFISTTSVLTSSTTNVMQIRAREVQIHVAISIAIWYFTQNNSVIWTLFLHFQEILYQNLCFYLSFYDFSLCTELLYRVVLYRISFNKH